MPRTTKAQREAKQAQERQEAHFAALLARPFADGSTDPYGARSEAARKAVAESIAADKASGLSGAELRTKYGARLTGPARRKVLRSFGLDSPATIARSYDAYRDGSARVGTRHAREHGARAAERREQALQAALDARFADGGDLADAKAQRALLRSAGATVPRNAAKLAAQARSIAEQEARSAAVATA